MAQSKKRAGELAVARIFARQRLHNDDLWWFWNEAASDLGERSNQGSVVALIEGARGTGSGGLDEVALLPVESDRALRAAKRQRRIRAILARCSDDATAVLQAFHVQRNWGDLDVAYPDGYAGVVVVLLAGRKAQSGQREVLVERARDAVLAALAAYRQATEALLAA